MRRKAFCSRGDLISIAIFTVLCIGMWFVDLTPPHPQSEGTKERGRVLTVDNSRIMQLGLLQSGPQILTVEILSGPFAGEVFPAANELRAQKELDKIFEVGDIALVGVLHHAEPGKTMLNAQDHYRLGWSAVLFGLFAVFLVLFGRITGFKALLSFVFSCLVVWKLLVPLCLVGYSALWLTIGCVTILTAVILFLIAGWSRKFAAAFAGSILGVLAGCAMAAIFTALFKINGAVMPYSQALLYSGYEYLSLSDIYIGAIILGSSGAVTDLGMDVAVGIEEVSLHNPELSSRELMASGMRIGRSVVGTMTTTLLMAYAGGYLTLMMTFAAQGTEPIDFINNPHVASEMVKTMVGSFALILVAPFTAFAGGIIFGRKPKGNGAQPQPPPKEGASPSLQTSNPTG